MARGGKQKDLPGMENRRIDEIHNKGIELEAVRSERMRYTKMGIHSRRLPLGICEDCSVELRQFPVD